MGGKLRQSLPEGAHLHAQQSAHDELFLLVNHVSKFVLATDKGGINLFYLLCSFRVDENSIGLIQVVISGGPADWPVAREAFLAGEDFFHQHIARGRTRRGVG